MCVGGGAGCLCVCVGGGGLYVCMCVCVCVSEQCGVILALCGSQSWVGGWVRVGWYVCIHNCLASCCTPIRGSIPPGLEGGEVFCYADQSMETVDPLRI